MTGPMSYCLLLSVCLLLSIYLLLSRSIIVVTYYMYYMCTELLLLLWERWQHIHGGGDQQGEFEMMKM